MTKKIKIFISWSKDPSKKIAESLSVFIKRVFTNKIETFISSVTIKLGEDGIGKIHAALKASEKGIFCITKNNINSVWMAYEAGSLSTHKKTGGTNTSNDNPVLPILFENIEQSEFEGHPFVMQRYSFSRETMHNLVKELNVIADILDEEALNNQFNMAWITLESEVKKALHDYSIGGGGVLNKDTLLKELASVHFPDPTIGEIIKYKSGFEKQTLYEVLLNNVQKRFLIFGRKNSKLFSNNNRKYFESLKKRLDEKPPFEFKCLFVDPYAKNLDYVQNHPNFIGLLKMAISNAYNVLEQQITDPSLYCRAYKTNRLDEIIIADNIVLFSPICIDEYGITQHLTDAPFNVVELTGHNQIGALYKKTFDDTWDNAIPITKEFIDGVNTNL